MNFDIGGLRRHFEKGHVQWQRHALERIFKQGFTLIEIIIVIIILGILAAVALPKVTQNIDLARASEAFHFGGAVAKAFDRCIMFESGDIASCDSFAEMNIADPISDNFTYGLSVAGDVLTMTVIGKFTGAVAADNVTFTYNSKTGKATKACDAGSKFIKMCK
jgi:prepilin-type N-terminal cleavage/methylation domain-containing protein